MIPLQQVVEEASGIDANGKPEADRLPEIENASALMGDETAIIPPELIHGVRHQGCKLIVGSSSKARKTWLLMNLAMSVATGTRWLKWDTAQRRVCYINF